MGAPTTPHASRNEHLRLARRQRVHRLTPAERAWYREIHRALLCELLSGEGRVVLLLEEVEAAEARGAAVDDLPRAIALGRAWWVAWAPGEPPLVCEGSSAEDVLASLTGLV